MKRLDPVSNPHAGNPRMNFSALARRVVLIGNLLWSVTVDQIGISAPSEML